MSDPPCRQLLRTAMPNTALPIVNWNEFNAARRLLGTSFVRVLGYFEEDAIVSLNETEQALRDGNAAGMVLPTHKLKSEARQFGAERLGQLAEDIEDFARACVESHETPETSLEKVVQLRPTFELTLAEIKAEVSPLVQRRPGFGRKVA